MKDKNSIEFYVDGMHCAACELLIEKELSKHNFIKSVKASLNNGKVLVKLESSQVNQSPEFALELNDLVFKHGYRITLTRPDSKKIKWEEFIYATPIGIGVIIIFLILQQLRLVNFINPTGDNLAYPVIFFIGIVASLSSCMAVVGGIVLSMAATYAKAGKTGKNISQITFHAARIIGFFILGGLLGLLGSSFKLTNTAYFFLEFVIAIVMIILALNMMNIFPILKNLQPRMPKFFSKKALDLAEFNSAQGKIKYILTPLLLGVATFFLPCGFTQSMQLYALSTGNLISGAMTMFIFALGTFPVLGLVSFASISLSQSKNSGIFFKTAGIIVLFFALINILGAFASIGLIQPVLNF